MIVVMAGLPGTGKSTLARALAQETGGIVLNKDILRESLFPEEFLEYSTQQDDFVQDAMQRTAEYLLTRHSNLAVFFDGRTFSRRYQLDSVIGLAEKLGTPWRIIECICSESVAEHRIERAERHPAKNRSIDLYRRIRDQFEAIDKPKLLLNTDGAFAPSLAAAKEYLKSST